MWHQKVTPTAMSFFLIVVETGHHDGYSRRNICGRLFRDDAQVVVDMLEEQAVKYMEWLVGPIEGPEMAPPGPKEPDISLSVMEMPDGSKKRNISFHRTNRYYEMRDTNDEKAVRKEMFDQNFSICDGYVAYSIEEVSEEAPPSFVDLSPIEGQDHPGPLKAPLMDQSTKTVRDLLRMISKAPDVVSRKTILEAVGLKSSK